MVLVFLNLKSDLTTFQLASKRSTKESRCNSANDRYIQKSITIHIKIRNENVSRSSLALRVLKAFFGAVNTGMFQLCKDTINNGVVLINIRLDIRKY